MCRLAQSRERKRSEESDASADVACVGRRSEESDASADVACVGRRSEESDASAGVARRAMRRQA